MMRSLRPVLIAALLGLAAVASAPRPARAQAADDDWDVKRNPFDARVIAGYKGILARNPDDASALRKLMALYTRYSSLDKLVAEYEARLKTGKGAPRFEDVMVLGHIWRARGDVPRAVARYEGAAQLEPGSPSVHLALAELYRQTQRPADALAQYEAALPLARDKKTQKVILRAAADLALEQKDIQKARAFYQRYLELDPHDITAMLDLGEALAKHGLHAEALEEYELAAARLATDPARRVEVLARIGMEEEALGKDDDAVATYRKCMDLTHKGHYLRKELTQRVIGIYRKKQDLRGLIAYYDKAWPPAGRGHFEWDTMASLYDEAGEQDKAIAAYKAAVKAAPYELDTQRRYIAALERAGRQSDALAQYEVVIRVAPGEPRFQLELAERVWNKGDRKRALELARSIAAHFPDDAGVHGALAEAYSRWGIEDLALKEYEFLARIEPDDDSHIVDLGEQYFQRGDVGRATEIWKKIIVIKTPERYARLAEVFAEHDRGGEAIEMYRRAIALKPGDPTLYRGMAMTLERLKGHDDDAIAQWQKVLELTAGQAAQKPLRKEARTHIIGVLYRQQRGGGKLQAEAHSWERKLQGEPPDLEAGAFAAEAYVRLGAPADAERVLLRMLKITPDDVDTMVTLVGVYKALGKPDKAVALLTVLVTPGPDGKTRAPGREREFYLQMAELETEQVHDDQAIIYAQKALEKSPNDAKSQQALAEIYEKRQDLDAAAAAYERAVAAAPRDFELAFALAKLQGRRGKPEEAVKIYRDVVKRATDEDTVRRAARKAIDTEEMLGTLGDLERELSPLVFTYGGKPYYRRILVELYGRYVPQLRTRASHGEVAATKELTAIADRGLRPLLEALADEDDPSQRKIAVATLGDLGNVAAARPLIKLAASAAPERSLAPLPGGAPLAVTSLKEGPSMELRLAALVAAGRLADPSIIGDLAPLARFVDGQGPDSPMREAAVWALGQTRDARAVPMLIAALDDEQPSVKALAAIALGRIGDRRGLAVVATRLGATGTDFRAACAYALGLAAKPIGQQQLLEIVGSSDKAPGDLLMRAAVWALGRMGERRAVPLLLTMYFSASDDVRQVILWALPRAAGEVAPEGAPRETELVALGASGTNASTIVDERLLPELTPAAPELKLIGQHAPAIIAGLRRALAMHVDKQLHVLGDLDLSPTGLALGPLTAGIEAASPADRAAIDKVRAQVAREIAPLVTTLTTSPDHAVRALAVSVVGKAAQLGADDTVAQALADDDPAVRRAALAVAPVCARALGGARLVKAVAEIASGAQAWEERLEATTTLGALGGAAAVTQLARLAQDDDSAFVREAATRGLAASGDSAGIVDDLIAASQDPVAEVRLAAAAGLKTRKDPRAARRLAALARDPDGRVRAVAVAP
jgi:tetratricopeptide (TPR) repeat protein